MIISIGIRFRRRGMSERRNILIVEKDLASTYVLRPLLNFVSLISEAEVKIGIAGKSSETRGRQEDEIEVKTEYQCKVVSRFDSIFELQNTSE